MKKFSVLLLMAVLAAPALANVTMFLDDFNTENGGVAKLNYTGFSNWTVSDGTVDLIGNGNYDFLPGNGLYVDMDGSTNNAGKMIRSKALLAGTYVLSYDLAGNHRNGSQEVVLVEVSVGLVSANHTLTTYAPFTSFSQQFTLASAQTIAISFAGVGGDNVGMLLDNVKLEQVSPLPAATVPAPGALLLGSLGTGLVGWLRKRKA